MDEIKFNLQGALVELDKWIDSKPNGTRLLVRREKEGPVEVCAFVDLDKEEAYIYKVNEKDIL